jgi:hypothetical protein
MARRYHWKHGWIPLDRAAALSKAKGDRAAASRYRVGEIPADEKIRNAAAMFGTG